MSYVIYAFTTNPCKKYHQDIPMNGFFASIDSYRKMTPRSCQKHTHDMGRFLFEKFTSDGSCWCFLIIDKEPESNFCLEKSSPGLNHLGNLHFFLGGGVNPGSLESPVWVDQKNWIQSNEDVFLYPTGNQRVLLGLRDCDGWMKGCTWHVNVDNGNCW